MKKESNTNRRSILRAIGAAGAAATIPGVAAASSGKSSAKKRYRKLLKVREKADLSNEEWRTLLKRNGFTVHTEDTSTMVPYEHPSSEGVSTAALDEYRLDFNMTYSYRNPFSPNYFIELEWAFDYGSATPYGESPNDLVTIEWESDDYVYNSKYMGPYCQPNSNGSSEGATGIAIKWDDHEQVQDEIQDHVGETNPDYSFSEYCGAMIDAKSDAGPPSERQFFFKLYHISNSIDLSVSISTGGVSVTPSTSSNYSWIHEENGVQTDY